MKNANPLPTGINPQSVWKLVDRSDPNGCWPWIGKVDKHGYGVKRFGSYRLNQSRQIAAHRVAYAIAVGPFPIDLVLDHLCMNKRCCNPAHLEPVTSEENVRRAREAQAA